MFVAPYATTLVADEKSARPATKSSASPLRWDHMRVGWPWTDAAGRSGGQSRWNPCKGGVMATVVLVHGAWQGAWCWERVTPILEATGHNVVTPTLTGSGTRAAQLSRDVNLQTHVADVAAAVRDIDDPVILAGHSYSGMLLPGVADQVTARLSAIVFVDAFYPADGQSAIDLMPEPFPGRFRDLAASAGDGWLLPAGEALLDVWGLDDPADRAWVRERLTDWSLTCFESPSVAPAHRIGGLPRWYVAGAKDCPSRAVFAEMARLARADGCTVVDAASGHDVMIEAPDMVAAVVCEALNRTPEGDTG